MLIYTGYHDQYFFCNVLIIMPSFASPFIWWLFFIMLFYNRFLGIMFNLLCIIHILYSLCSQLLVTLGKCTCIDYKNIKSQGVIFQNYPLFQLIDNTIIDIYEGNFRNLPILDFWLFKRDQHFGTSQNRTVDQQLGIEGVLLSGQWKIEVSVRSWVVIQRLWRGDYWIDMELPRLDLREEDGG